MGVEPALRGAFQECAEERVGDRHRRKYAMAAPLATGPRQPDVARRGQTRLTSVLLSRFRSSASLPEGASVTRTSTRRARPVPWLVEWASVSFYHSASSPRNSSAKPRTQFIGLLRELAGVALLEFEQILQLPSDRGQCCKVRATHQTPVRRSSHQAQEKPAVVIGQRGGSCDLNSLRTATRRSSVIGCRVRPMNSFSKAAERS